MAVASIVGTIGGSIVSGAMQSSAAKKASRAQQNSVNHANAIEQGFFDQTKESLDPFINTGHSAAAKLRDLEGLDGGNSGTVQAALEGLPGYQFANQQGLKSVQNSATARGLGVSGAAQKASATYSTGLANQYYNNLLTGVQNTENTGEAAGASLGGVASSIGESIGANTIGGGNAKAAGEIGSANAISNAVGGIPSAFLTGALYKGFGNENNQNENSLYSVDGLPDLTAPLKTNGGYGYGTIGNGLNDWTQQGY